MFDEYTVDINFIIWVCMWYVGMKEIQDLCHADIWTKEFCSNSAVWSKMWLFPYLPTLHAMILEMDCFLSWWFMVKTKATWPYQWPSVSRSLMPNSAIHGLHVTRLLSPWDFSRQGYWSGLPFPSPGDLPDPGIEPGSPALQAFFTNWATREAQPFIRLHQGLP